MMHAVDIFYTRFTRSQVSYDLYPSRNCHILGDIRADEHTLVYTMEQRLLANYRYSNYLLKPSLESDLAWSWITMTIVEINYDEYASTA